MAKKVKVLPRFRTEDEEREFWATHDSTPYFEASSAVRARSPISSRPPRPSRFGCLSTFWTASGQRQRQGRALQSLIKVWLSENWSKGVSRTNKNE